MTAGAILFCLVVAIADGDSLTCLTDDRQQVKVRLAEIDAPESRQAFGARSRLSLGDLCHERRAQVRVVDIDRYGRTVGRVTCAGVDANAEQVRRGMAWVYDRYAQDRSLYQLQDHARATRLGLWADGNPQPPWEWRQAQAQAAAPRAPIAPVRQTSGSAHAVAEVRGNKSSGIYHVPGCRNYNDVSQRNRVIFSSEEQAQAAGYRKARNCR